MDLVGHIQSFKVQVEHTKYMRHHEYSDASVEVSRRPPSLKGPIKLVTVLKRRILMQVVAALFSHISLILETTSSLSSSTRYAALKPVTSLL